MIVDSSALLAMVLGESDADRYASVLFSSRKRHISAATMVEVRMVAVRLGLLQELDELIEMSELEIVPVDEAQAKLAIEGFERFGKGRHTAGLNYGDLFAYALARSLGEPLLFKGADFARTDVRVALA
ncbi:MAG: type II toxin-antitoxin system VapC family toxin [Rhodospirillales bacterium]|nr:MAG: type II toxin-antitoxin system VapC family toxin [Rhodospirillales bacterium]